MNIRNFTLIILIIFASQLGAQTIALPDSAAVINNHVKVAHIYFKGKDGKRYKQKQLWYNEEGQLVREQEGENSFYYVYAYDKSGRRVLTTQRTKDGAFIQKFAVEYIAKDTTRKVSLYLLPDSTKVNYVYVYDRHENKIREEQYRWGVLEHLYTIRYDGKGNVISSYDSTVSNRTVTVRDKGLLSKHRTYDPQGKLLHEYSYTYDYFGRIWKLADSTGVMKTVNYMIVYSENGGPVQGIKRDNKLMSSTEESLFRKEHPYIFPQDNIEYNDYGLPVPDMINQHNFTFDKKGNIIRDDLEQKQGSSSETYVYEYEYEFF